MRLQLTIGLSALLAIAPLSATAFDLEQSLRELHVQNQAVESTDLSVAQRGNGKTLSEAIASVRNQTKGRVISAETRISGNREVHHIKVLTEDGKVRTFKVPGRSTRG